MSYSRDELERATAKNEIVPHFQPLVEMQTGKVIGFEALARWQHPRDGLVLPKDFILLTEAYGLSRNLTSTIIRQTVETARSLPPHLHYTFNISPLQLRDPSLPRSIEDAVRAGDPSGGFSLDRLVVEITESAFIHNLSHAANIASEIKALGMRLALDDFGTGYSSLLHLQSLPFDIIKVDQSFVREMARQRDSRKIVFAVLGLGMSLGLTTVAEGIEEEEQERMLQRYGCDVGQGWRFGYPMPAEALPEFLAIAEKPSEPQAGLPVFSRPKKQCVCQRHPASLNLMHLQTAFTGVEPGLCLLDQEMHIACLNDQMVKMLHRPVKTLIGQPLEDLLPQAAFELRPYVLRAFRGESIYGIEVPLSSLSTRQPTTYGLASLQPARDETGEIIGVSAFVSDITRRKQVHQALRHSHALFNALWNNAPFGIVIAVEAGDLHILSGNPEAERILRHAILLPSQDMEQKSWRIFNEEAKPIAWEDTPLMRAIHEVRSVPSERVLYLRGDDTLATLQLSAAPLLTASGKVLGAVMTLTDAESTFEKLDDDNLAASLTASLWDGGGTSGTFDSLVDPTDDPHVPVSSIE